MGTIEKTKDEADRLATLDKYNLLDREIEQEFQNIVRLAAFICDVPSSLVSIVGADRQWFKGKVGNPNSGSARKHSFCAHTILQDDLFIVSDARKDARFQDNPLVYGTPNIVFYAGFPLNIEGHNIGTLCIHDKVPKVLSEEQISGLRLLTFQTTKLVELRGKEIELKEQNDLIHKRNEELNESNKINKQLMSMISHDIRGPIGSILSLFNSITGLLDNLESFKKIKPLMETSLRSIYSMIDNMLYWSSHINSTVVKRVNVIDAVLEIERLFASQLKVKGNTLHLLIEDSIYVGCDENALSFIIRNLVGNAIKYTSEGEITVAAEIVDDQVKIAVTDTGKGISESLLEAVLNKDKAASTKGTQGESGSGMGINFIQQFLDKMDSKLTITSVEQEGSTFSFLLPLA